MKIRHLCLLVISVLLISSCTPAKFVRLSNPIESERSEVFVYRESAFNSGGVNAIFGANGNDYVKLGNSTFAELALPAGSHEFFVRSDQADVPFTHTLHLTVGAKKCLRIFPNPGNLKKSLEITPFSFFTSNTFALEEVTCPSSDVLKKFKQVSQTD